MSAVASENTQPGFDNAENTGFTLESALEALKDARRLGLPDDTPLDWCKRLAPGCTKNPGALTALVHYFLQTGDDANAVYFTRLILRIFPAKGVGYRLFGEILKARGEQHDASICMRYALPQSIVDEHFNVPAERRIDSHEADSADIQRVSVFDASRVELQQPIRVESAVIRQFSDSVYRAREAYTAILPDGRLWFDGFLTAVWDRRDRLIMDISKGNAELVDSRRETHTPVRINGRVALIGNRNAKNYYHWMNDVLPSLELIRRAGIPLDSIDRFVVNPLTCQFQHETLAHFGIDESRLHTIRDGEFIAADELIVPRYGSNSLGASQGRWNPDFLRKEFAPAQPPAQTRKLYISRGTSGSRSVRNETELQDVLAQRGFEIVSTDGMSIIEQAALFSQASVVIGPHGAGFSNIAFCGPGTRILEMFSSHFQPCFWSIASALNFTYAALYCDDSEYADGVPLETSLLEKPREHREAGFRVNPQQLAEALDKLDTHSD
ncbi:glycosyltransferase family 61 protein [Granulosicoccus sp. 3-233]|uniref:glycosyltransferase family 61 protein n=1 Tax=Granulosicoccus sp. 3-233 TaxID=3417969 RepID=UPI003D334FC7